MNLDVKKRLGIFGQRALSRPNTVFNSYELPERCIKNGIEGDFVECGVFAGTQSAAMALANQVNEGGRKVHLFDSFVGLPEAGPKDDTTITSLTGVGQGRLISIGIDVCTAAQVEKHMNEWNIDISQLVYHKGWFQDTVPKAVKEGSVKKIAVLRLDGDYYESTKVCMEHLHPLVEKGGYVIVDDYAMTGCRAAMMEYWGKLGLKFEVIQIPNSGGPVFYRR